MDKMEYLLSVLSGVVPAETNTAMKGENGHGYHIDIFRNTVHNIGGIWLGIVNGSHKYRVCGGKCDDAQYDHDSGRETIYFGFIAEL